MDEAPGVGEVRVDGIRGRRNPEWGGDCGCGRRGGCGCGQTMVATLTSGDFLKRECCVGVSASGKVSSSDFPKRKCCVDKSGMGWLDSFAEDTTLSNPV